jgi:hypothetical protein
MWWGAGFLYAVKIKSSVPAIPAVISVLLCLYWCGCAGLALAADSASRVVASCHLSAVITPDNDIRLDDDNRPPGRNTELPSKVLGEVRALGAQMLRTSDAPDPYPGECNDLFGKVFRIPVSRGVYLYAAEVSPISAIKLLFLILYDPATGAVTRNPPKIDVKSTQMFGSKDPLLDKPLISFADLLQNHRRQIVVEERVHNGTMYNGVVYNYFDVGTDLSLTQVLALEKRVLAIGAQEGLIVRSVERSGHNQLRLDSFLTPEGKPRERQELGYVILETAGPGTPFHVKQRHPKSKDSDSILVTYSGAIAPGSDDAFLRNGYTFHY